MRRVLSIIFGLFLLFQLVYFWDYIGSYHGKEVKASALWCTCPDMKVISGIGTLRQNTPDSLTKYNLDYSEMYVEGNSPKELPNGAVDFYMLKGEVIGKRRVYEKASWNPVFRVDAFRVVDPLFDYGMKGVFILELIAFIFSLRVFRKQLNWAVKRQNPLA